MRASTSSHHEGRKSKSSSMPDVNFKTSDADNQKRDTEINRLYSMSFSQLRQNSEFADYQFKPSPYQIHWVHGYNNKAGMINLNDQGTTILFYAACNFGVLYNWSTNKMRILQGHRHMITNIAADATGKWLVTGGTGQDNIIIVWDSRSIFPQRTIFNPHGPIKLSRLALSSDAKYLLTMGYGPDKAEVFWWIWSYGLHYPHAKIEVNIKREAGIAMDFNPAFSQQFLILTKSDIWIGDCTKVQVYERGIWKDTKDWQLKIVCAPKKEKIDVARNTCFCFVHKTGQIVVGTGRGAVLLYGYTLEHNNKVDFSDIEKLRYIKMIKIEKYKINVIKYVDGVIVTGNSNGEIHFYDDMMKLLYWVHGFKVDSVRCLSFNISPRSYVILDPRCNKICLCAEKVEVYKDPKTGVLATKFLKKKLATDATKGGLPFLVRDFIVCTLNEGIGFVDFSTEKLTTILDYKIVPVISISVHPEKPLICLGYMDGKMELLNFEEHKLRSRLNLRDYYKIITPPNEDSICGDVHITIPNLAVNCLKYSPSGLHLASGLNTGQIMFLDPTTIEILTKVPFKDTKFGIQLMDYSPDSLTMAASDEGKTVLVYKYDCEAFKWNFVGKHRAHYKDVTSVLFLPKKNPDGNYKLLSFGKDRIMVEYDIGSSYDEGLEVMSLDRVEQTATPLASVVWPSDKGLDPETHHTDMPLVLTTNDEYKYKIINYETTMTLQTALGPRFDFPVSHVILTKRLDEKGKERRYLIFGTKYVIGLQMLPLDGNPWKHCGILGHPFELLTLDYRHDLESLFTIGKRDNCMCQWNVNFGSTERMTRLGGNELDPYYCLIEDGRPGWLFQEIRDLFYYIQILCQGTFSPAMRRVKDVIPIDSLPDLMRALGYFPSEFEVENLIVEAKFQIYNKIPITEISFEEFVKLYLNHRPPFAFTPRKIKKAFKHFANYSKKEDYYWRRDDFVDVLCKYGENFSKELAYYLLSILAGHSFEDRAANPEPDFSFLPLKIKWEDLATTILGIPDIKIPEVKDTATSEISVTTAGIQQVVLEREESTDSEEGGLQRAFSDDPWIFDIAETMDYSTPRRFVMRQRKQRDSRPSISELDLGARLTNSAADLLEEILNNDVLGI